MLIIPDKTQDDVGTLKDWHRCAIRALVSGARVKDVAERFNRSRAAVWACRRTPEGRAFAKTLRDQLDDVVSNGALLAILSSKPVRR